MSGITNTAANTTGHDDGAPFALIRPHVKDLGGFSVRRTLPGHPHKMVGPFIFFDHMGPAHFEPGHGVDVRPHPHIGLATVTYLFEGALQHRDSLGTEQVILPGDVNWMTAGRGIAHSERTPDELRAAGSPLHGIQIWVALPKAHETTEPAFEHAAIDDLPMAELEGVTVRIIAGSLLGMTSPVTTFSPMFYAAARFEAGANGQVELPADVAERAVYAVDDGITVDGVPVPQYHMAVLRPGRAAIIAGSPRARAMLLGGEKMDGDRFIWWNFVASSREAIAEAKERWARQEFGAVPRETEWIPLPEDKPSQPSTSGAEEGGPGAAARPEPMS